MSSVHLQGILSIERMSFSTGDSVRTSFVADCDPRVVFACWVKEEQLSGNIRHQVEGTLPEGVEASMIGYASFADVVVGLVQDNEEDINTFGIGECFG